MGTHTAARQPDLVATIADFLKRHGAVGDHVAGRIGGVGDFQGEPNAIEIGHTVSPEAADERGDRHLVTVHVWSKQDGPEEVEALLEMVCHTVVGSIAGLSVDPGYTEVRFDDRRASYHGLLRLIIAPA